MNKFNTFLNNIQVKHKLILIYIFCVFAPIIIINAIFYQNTITNVKEIQKNYYRLSTQRLVTQFNNDFNFIVSLSNKISLDQKLYEMLDREYQNNLEYSKAYFDYFKPYLYLNGESAEQVNKMVLYTDNPTILHSGVVYKIDSAIRNQSWFKEVVNSPHKLHIIYGESEKEADDTLITPISIIQVLNEYHSIDRYTKVLRMDLHVARFDKTISSENIKGNVFIFNNMDKLIFANRVNSISNTEDYLKKPVDEAISSKTKYFNWNIINIIDDEDLKEALRGPRNRIILLTLLSLFLSSLIILLIYRSLYIRLNSLSEHVNNLDHGDFDHHYKGEQGRDEIGKLIRAYNRMIKKIKTLIMDVYESKIEQSNIELEKKQAELNALQSQMNPHFLFNTLESIRMKSIEKKEIETAEIISYITRSFRRMIRFKQEWIELAEEVGYIKDFLKVQKYRYGSEIEYILDIDSDTLNIKIPKLVIQPFVENACIHGIEGSEEIGQIIVRIYILEKQLKCIIKDNGIGMSKDQLSSIMSDINSENIESDNIGISNIYKRLDLYYGNRFEINIDSEEGKGTAVHLTIPLEA